MNLLTKDQIDDAKRLSHINKGPNAARGIIIGMMVGTAVWLIIGIVIYFTFFGGM